MQGRDLSLNTAIIATAKHFAGDGGSQGGANPGNTSGTDAVLRAIHLPPYASAIEAGVGCIMPSFSSWNGVGSHANKPLLTDWLKTQQGFDGFVVGDWTAHTFQGGSGRQACVNACISAGLDNPMAPGVGAQTQADILAGNASGGISTDRINDACRRILRALFRKGMFENYHALAGYNSYFHSDLHKQVARQCVAASMVVLKNESSTLPLKKGNQKIAVIGMWGNDVGLQCGGWTLGWQGAPGAQKPAGTTMYMSLQQQGGGNTVTYSADGSTIPSDANVVVVCVGMNPAAEYTKSDNQLQLLDSQYGKISDLMGKASASGKPIVLALFVDAPVVVTQYITQAKAVVCAWLGSPEGGGFGDILYGDVHPTGKLNHTWPSTISQIPINDGNMGDATGSGGTPLYPLGYGLTY
jgi:beta-glucosidase